MCVKDRLAQTIGSDSSILIVEDQAIARRALASLLGAIGYRTHAVGSAEEALKAVAEGHVPGIALIDVDLPGMSGLELVGRLEASFPSIVPVLITASDREKIDAFRNTRPVKYMRKPIDFAALLAFLGSQCQPTH